jgi:hypothetical protein
MEPSPQRARLGFREAALSSFVFLKDMGFRLVECKTTFVRYESSEVFVNIYHGRASFELGVEIGSINEPSEKFTLQDIITWAGAEKAEGFGQHVMFQVSSRNGVNEFVPKLAHLVARYGAAFLKADASAYHSVRESRLRSAAEFEKNINLKNARRRADVAWHAKDYVQVVKLYSSLRQELSKVETKRLAYAERRVLSDEGMSSQPTTRPTD